jgi:enamine deaminase RidA (YjgF/YER057c/UK114 family)
MRGLVYTSGQLPIRDGILLSEGLIGRDLTVEAGAELARLCTVNALAAIAGIVDLDAISRVVKVTGFVASTPDFTAQSAVIDGASTFLEEVFGDAGKHSRSAVGVAALPLGAPVEVELVVALLGD